MPDGGQMRDKGEILDDGLTIETEGLILEVLIDIRNMLDSIDQRLAARNECIGL